MSARRDLFSNGQCLEDRNRSLSDAIRERWPLDELHHQRRDVATLFDAVDLRDVRVVQRRQHFGLTLKAREAIGID
jgi:hypothetical protein